MEECGDDGFMRRRVQEWAFGEVERIMGEVVEGWGAVVEKASRNY